MNLYEVWRRLCEEWIAALVAAALAVVVAVLLTYHVSFSPVSLRGRALQMGVAQSSVLVDARRSTIASTQGAAGLGAITNTLAQLVNSEPIIAPIARALGVAPDSIGVQVQVSQQVPLSQSQPLEPQVGTEILATRHRYYLVAHDTSGGQVIGLYAQAPNGRLAVRMVEAAQRSLRDYVAAAARSNRPSGTSQIVIRPLGNVYGRVLDSHVSEDAAVLIAVLAWVLAMTGWLTLRNQALRARTQSAAAALNP
jgi:hypothetical protein